MIKIKHEAFKGITFYGKPVNGGDFFTSDSIWYNKGSVFLYRGNEWVEVDKETIFYVEQ